MTPASQTDARTQSLTVARMMLRGAVGLFREEIRRGASEARVAEAREGVVFWRQRLQTLALRTRA